jgi:hypothetical protein
MEFAVHVMDTLYVLLISNNVVETVDLVKVVKNAVRGANSIPKDIVFQEALNVVFKEQIKLILVQLVHFVVKMDYAVKILLLFGLLF